MVESLGMDKILDAISEFSDKMSDIAYRNAMKAYFVAGSLKYIKNPDLKALVDDRFYMNVVKLFAYPSLKTSKDMLMHGTMFIGSMHFQDSYNFDLDRVERCVVTLRSIRSKGHNECPSNPFLRF